MRNIVNKPWNGYETVGNIKVVYNHRFTPKKARGSIWLSPPLSFSKKCFLERGQIFVFVRLNIIKNHIFPENFIEIAQVFQKLWRFSPSILTIFIGFLEFLTVRHCKETIDVSIKHIMSAFFYFQPTLSKLFTNFIKLY